jgi:oligopeptidase B
MKRFAVFSFASISFAAQLQAQQPKPPAAQMIAHVDTLHGDIRTDNYFWLREKTNPKVLAYLDSENAYTATAMRHTEPLQDKLYHEMLGRLKETDLSVPYRDNGYWYYSRTEQGKAYPILCRKRGSLDAKEEIYLDENALAAGKKFFSVGDEEVSPDGSKLVYLQDTTALRVYTLLVKDLATGKTLADTLGQIVPGLAWANDNRTIFYSTADSARRNNAVWMSSTTSTSREARAGSSCSSATMDSRAPSGASFPRPIRQPFRA